MRAVSLTVTTYCCISFSLASGRTIDVDVRGSTGIQEAVLTAASGDVILVGPGEYMIHTPIRFTPQGDPHPDGGKFVKNLTVRSTHGPESTIVRMEGDGPVVAFLGGEGAQSLLQGFTLTGGNGGIRCEYSSPTIRDCLITGNRALAGAGVLCIASWPLLDNCTISRNAAEFAGGGVRCVEGSGPILTDCTISQNTTLLHGTGGGGLSSDDSFPTLVGCTISGNASYFGGGVHSVRSDLYFGRSVISGNSVERSGGGFWMSESTALLTRCTVFANRALADEGDVAGAFYCERSSRTTLTNSTVADNSVPPISVGTSCAGLLLKASTAQLTNCIVWNHFRGPLAIAERAFTWVSFSCVEGRDVYPGYGNTNEAPLFQSAGRIRFDRFTTFEVAGAVCSVPEFIAAAPDYSLQSQSPCIDAGTVTFPPTLDMFGHASPCGDGVDMGAYEYGECTYSTPFQRGDANADGSRTIADARWILSYLYADGPRPRCEKAADCDDSGDLQLTDGAFLLNFLFLGGQRPPAPFGICALDPTPDELECPAFASCR